MSEIFVVGVTDFFLFNQKSILVLDFFSQIQVSLIFDAGLLSEAIEVG
jgi:hypothetical protein